MRKLAILAMVGTLAACKGGGSGNVQPDEVGIDGEVEVNTLLVSDMIVTYQGIRERLQSQCNGPQCTFSYQGLSETVDIDDILQSEPDAGIDLDVTSSLHGVRTFTARGSQSLDGQNVEQYGYGGWLNESGFVVSTTRFSGGQLDGARLFYTGSVGYSPGTNPNESDGGGTWSGAMLGVDTNSRERVEGAATIDIDDFSNPDVDVAFTEVETASGQSRSDMTWMNISLHDGDFRTGYDGDSIEGHFYGDTHQEVGGVFERNRLLGAFGASRD